MTLSTATRTQLRAICPVCFAQQAVTAAGRLAQHGYRRPQGWHQNVNDCGGSGRMHFGTEAGRATTAAQANGIRDYAEAERERAPKVASGELPLRDRQGNVVTHAPWKLAQIADGIVRNAKYADEHAAELDAKVAAWVAVEPITVTVEKKAAPVLHFYSSARHGKLCAVSFAGARHGHAVSERAAVTCPKCLARLAALDAKLAAALASA